MQVTEEARNKRFRMEIAMKYKSKVVGLIAAAVLVAGLLGGCGDSGAPAVHSREQPTEVQSEALASESVEESVLDAAESSEEAAESSEPVVEEKPSSEAAAESEDGSVSSVELARLMGNGINLGNTMEAYGRSSFGVGAAVSSYETCWGMPVTTQEMISAMKAAGFDTLRVPVAWTNAMNFESGDYTIGADYLDRVGEIIDYAMNEDMYVIVNDHWDGGWWGMFGSASEETRAAAKELYVSMWTQIAERYADYDYHLIFESANEELGYRLNDTDIAADSGTLSDDECYEMTNQINQTFVDTIRSTGGGNAERYLLIAGFGTDITTTCDGRYVMPADTAKDKLLISVHFYDPSGYCIFDSISSWGTKKNYEDQNNMLAKMQQFTEAGYGVVIGEYGVLPVNGIVKDNTLEYTTNFLNNCDLYGYCPVLWDCSGMFNRNTLQIIVDEMAELYQEHSFAAQSSRSDEEIRSEAETALQTVLEGMEDEVALADDQAIAWIMYTSSDWSVSYSVGDVYDPVSATAGLVATDVEITGEGTYTVALDFTQTSAGAANSTTFSALAVGNGETLFPGYCIEIKEILINGEPYKMTGRPYTASDDGICTRVNLYNEWVSAVPDDARTASGNAMYVTPTVLDKDTLGMVETIEITFDYVPGK